MITALGDTALGAQTAFFPSPKARKPTRHQMYHALNTRFSATC